MSDEKAKRKNVEDNSEINEETGPMALKVKSDPDDISSEDRKKNAKRLAGAITHSLRNNGEVSVRAFGFSAIGKAAKSLAIAKNNLKFHDLQLECSPAFITSQVDDKSYSGICFYAFVQPVEEDSQPIDTSECKSVLRVKSDDPEDAYEKRKASLKALSQAINYSLEENKEVVLRCFGSAAIGKASKALAIARGMVATRGPDMYCYPEFIVAEINGVERTGLSFYAYVNI